MEHESERVRCGRLLGETSYKRAKKEISIGPVRYDFIRVGECLEVHDVKKSESFDEAHRLQLMYYLFVLKQGGIDAVGVIDFPLTNRHERIVPSQEDFELVQRAIEEIPKIVRGPIPPAIRMRYCGKCAYEEFCWCEEGEIEV